MKKYNIAILFICFCMVLNFGCSTTNRKNDIEDNKIDTEAMLKVVLIADSQFVSKKAKYYRDETIWNSQLSDQFVDVTLRVPVQNILAKHSLENLLYKSINERPDIVLYLGDGANN